MQNNRLYEFDIARIVPLLLLPFIHLYEEAQYIEHQVFMRPEVYTDNIWLMYISSFTAAVFMVSLGFNIHLSSRHKTASSLAKRGLFFLIGGVLLNFIRLGPGDILGACLGDSEAIPDLIWTILQADIFDFAGLAFLYLAFLKRFHIKPVIGLFIAALLSIITSLMPELELDGYYLNAFLGRFIWVDEESCFAFTQWIIFPAFGYWIGQFVAQKDANTTKLNTNHKTIVLFAVVVTIITISVMVLLDYNPLLIFGTVENDCRMTFPAAVLTLASVMCWYSLSRLYFWATGLNRINKFLVYVASMLSAYYVMQWIIIENWVFISMYLELPMPELGNAGFLVTSFIITAMSVAMASVYMYFHKRYIIKTK